MKWLSFVFVALVMVCSISSCKKDSFISSPDALLFTSADALLFDTVFTSTGSVTQSFKIFNGNNRKLLISNISLGGGSSSAFKINVDGAPGTDFSNIEIAANDSIYVFVAVTINPGDSTNPFFIEDSIRISYNGNNAVVKLDAYGQNARFLNNATVTADTTWTNELPVVLTGNLTVQEGKTLTIEKGTKIYCHAAAGIIVNGTLKALGGKYDSTKIIFRNDRLDDYYRDLPGSWAGITFTESSDDNMLEYVSLLNATNALIVRNPAANSNSKLTIKQCRINNASGAGITGIFSSINAVNLLVSNCGENIKLVAGGNYTFDHCTAAAYSNTFLTHESPVLSITDVDDNNQSFALTAVFTNSVFYGDDGIVTGEISLQQVGNNSFKVSFDNVLYKGDASEAVFVNCIQNEDPGFINLDTYNNVYDFHLQSSSPCVDAGKITPVFIDLDGNNRDSNPDIGCYEYLP